MDKLTVEELEKNIFDELVSSWFSHSRSSEAMKRGTKNEEAAMIALRGLDFVTECWECGMLGIKEHPWIAVSPDGIAVIDMATLNHSFDTNSFFEDSIIGDDGFLSCEFSMTSTFFCR